MSNQAETVHKTRVLNVDAFDTKAGQLRQHAGQDLQNWWDKLFRWDQISLESSPLQRIASPRLDFWRLLGGGSAYNSLNPFR